MALAAISTRLLLLLSATAVAKVDESASFLGSSEGGVYLILKFSRGHSIARFSHISSSIPIQFLQACELAGKLVVTINKKASTLSLLHNGNSLICNGFSSQLLGDSTGKNIELALPIRPFVLTG